MASIRRRSINLANKAFNARLKLACERARVPVISAHPLRHTAAVPIAKYSVTNCNWHVRYLSPGLLIVERPTGQCGQGGQGSSLC